MAISRGITAEQMRAARAMLRLEQSQLAEISGVSHGTVRRLEALSGTITAQEATLDAIRIALERAGIVFLDEDEGVGGPGVRPAIKISTDEPSEEQILFVKHRLQTAMQDRQHNLKKAMNPSETLAALSLAVSEVWREFSRRFDGPNINAVFQKAVAQASAQAATTYDSIVGKVESMTEDTQRKIDELEARRARRLKRPADPEK